MAVRSARIVASGTVRPAEGGPMNRLYETLASGPSTAAAVVVGFLTAQSPRWTQATKPSTRAIVPRDMVRLRPYPMPIDFPPGMISSAVFISARYHEHHL